MWRLKLARPWGRQYPLIVAFWYRRLGGAGSLTLRRSEQGARIEFQRVGEVLDDAQPYSTGESVLDS